MPHSEPPKVETISFDVSAPDIAEFLQFKFPPDDPILGAFNRNQIINLIGPTGLGKSQLGIYITWACAGQHNIFGWTSHRAVPVLYVDGEMSGSQLQGRLGRYDWVGEPVKIVNAINWCAQRGMPLPNLAEDEWQDRIYRWAPKGGVVVLDNLMSLVHVPGVSMLSDEFWTAVKPLNLRLRALGCTVIWVDHTNAEGKIFGTKTKEWQSDLVLTLMNNEKTPDFEEIPGTAFTIAFTKVRGERGPEHAPIDVEMTTDESGQVRWNHMTRKRAEQEIAAELRAEGMTQREIATEMNCSVGKVNKLLRSWVSAAEYREAKG